MVSMVSISDFQSDGAGSNPASRSYERDCVLTTHNLERMRVGPLVDDWASKFGEAFFIPL